MPGRPPQNDLLAAQLRHHETEMARLAAELRSLEAEDLRQRAARRAEPDAVFMAAQIVRHRIAMALLASRLSHPEPVTE